MTLRNALGWSFVFLAFGAQGGGGPQYTRLKDREYQKESAQGNSANNSRHGKGTPVSAAATGPQQIESAAPETQVADESAPPSPSPLPSSGGASEQRSLADVTADKLGSACTIVFMRHGNKASANELTKTGKAQAEDLGKALSEFEKAHGPFSNVLYSYWGRTQRTIEPFMRNNPNKSQYNQNITGKIASVFTPQGVLPSLDDKTSQLLKECDGANGSDAGFATCDKQVDAFIKDILKPMCTGGNKILIAAHGTLGNKLLPKLGAKPSEFGFSDGREARPFVLSSNSGVLDPPNVGKSFKLVHDASKFNSIDERK